MNDTSTAPATTAPATTSSALSWDDFVTTVEPLGGMFVATVQADGRPHVAWVSPGFVDGSIWFSTFRSSQKGVNLRHHGEVALHWDQRPDAIPFARATARLVEDRAESDRLWDAGVVPYDLGAFFSGKDDPELLLVQLTPTTATLGALDPSAPLRRWKPTAAQ